MRIRILLYFLATINSVAFSQKKITGKITGNPPYTKAILKVSFGSFPVAYDSTPVKMGQFEFKIADTLLQKQPSFVSIIFKNNNEPAGDLHFTNYMIPSKKNLLFYLSDDAIIFTGKYDSTKRQQLYSMNRNMENDVYLEGFTNKLFKGGGSARQSAVDSLANYVKKYTKSQYLLKEVFERRRWFTGQQLKSVANAFSPDVLSSEKGNKLAIFLENKIAEENHSEYKNLTLKNRAGKDVKIFDELKDVNLIVFWTSWCVPCRKEVPVIKKLYETLKARGVSFQFTHVSVDAKKELWEKADKMVAFPWKSLWSPKESTVAEAYNYGLPSNHLVTKDKRVFRIDIRDQEGIDAIYKALGLKPEKFEYPENEEEIKIAH